jgi:hypothetical protein
MASCPKRGVLNAGDRPGRLAAAVAQLVAAAAPYKPRIMPIATRRGVPASTPMPQFRSAPTFAAGLGNLPPGTSVQGGMPGLGNPGSRPYTPISGGGLGSNGQPGYNSPVTHGALGANGTTTGGGFTAFGTPGSAGGPASGANNPVTLTTLGPLINALTNWATEVTGAITAITETISSADGGGAFLWAADKLIAPYTEPLRIWTPEWVPLAIIAARIQDTRAMNTPIMTGCAVEWVQGVAGEYIEVRSIDGMAVNDGKTYLYTFLYFGIA